MFDIEYKGANTVVISTKKSCLVTDPKLSVVGLKDYVVNDAIELATEERFQTNDPKFKLSLQCPGSFEAGVFSINGFPEKRHLDGEDEPKKSIIYSIELMGVRIGLLGNIGPKLSDDQLENLGVLDMIILPVGGGGYTLDATSATTIAKKTDAKIVIPIHYKGEGINYEVPQMDVDQFEKEMGCEVEETTKFKLKSLSSIPEVIKIVKILRTN